MECSLDGRTQTPCEPGSYCPEGVAEARLCKAGHYCEDTVSEAPCLTVDDCFLGMAGCGYIVLEAYGAEGPALGPHELRLTCQNPVFFSV